jgi:cytochrome c
VSHGR